MLKPGGRLAVSDIALKKQLPDEIGQDLMAYVGCIAGATLTTTADRRSGQDPLRATGGRLDFVRSFAGQNSPTDRRAMVRRIGDAGWSGAYRTTGRTLLRHVSFAVKHRYDQRADVEGVGTESRAGLDALLVASSILLAIHREVVGAAAVDGQWAGYGVKVGTKNLENRGNDV